MLCYDLFPLQGIFATWQWRKLQLQLCSHANIQHLAVLCHFYILRKGNMKKHVNSGHTPVHARGPLANGKVHLSKWCLTSWCPISQSQRCKVIKLSMTHFVFSVVLSNYLHFVQCLDNFPSRQFSTTITHQIWILEVLWVVTSGLRFFVGFHCLFWWMAGKTLK